MYLNKLCLIFSYDKAGYGSESETCCSSDESAGEDVTEVVFTDKNAAYGYHAGPEIHPADVGLSPRGRLSCVREESGVELQADDRTGGQAEGICCVCGEEAKAPAAFFEDFEAVCKHEFVIQRADSPYEVFDQVRELVTEAEGGYCCKGYYQAVLPSEPPDQQGYDQYVHRDPHGDI